MVSHGSSTKNQKQHEEEEEKLNKIKAKKGRSRLAMMNYDSEGAVTISGLFS